MQLSPPPPSLSDLDAWIAQRESQFLSLKPGVQAGIRWASPRRDKTETSLVYLPGYTATRGEISPAVERIADALGANVFFVRPAGQGLGPEGHRDVTAKDWIRDGLEALAVGRLLGDRVVLIGTSTGGTLAAWLLLGLKQTVAATVLISPNLTPLNRASEFLLWPGKELWLSLFMGPYVNLERRNDLHAQFWDLHHHSHSLIPMMDLVQKARTADFSRWPSPALVVYDPEDNVVDETVTVRLFSRVPNALVTLSPWTAAPEDDHHVLAGDALSPHGTTPLVDLVTTYLRQTL